MKKLIVGFMLVLFSATFVYAGKCITGNCWNGNGVVQYEYGTYEGQFKNGLPHGVGIEYNINGCTFRGTFFKGLAHGWHNVTCDTGFDFRQEYRYGHSIN